MSLLQFLFHCGVIYIVFSFIWSFFMFLYNMLTQFRRKSPVETYLFKFINTYVLISLIGMLTYEQMMWPRHSPAIFATVGLLTVYSYLIGRLERNRMVFQLNNQVLRMGGGELHMRTEMVLVISALVYYIMCLVQPHIAVNGLTIWFSKAIHDLYDTPVIGWIFAFIGSLMLFSLLIRSLLYTSLLLNRLTGGNKRSGNKNDDDDYTDYEIME